MTYKTLHSLIASSLSVLDVASNWNTDGNCENDSSTDGDEDDVDGLQFLCAASEILVSAVTFANTVSTSVEGACSLSRAVLSAAKSSPDFETIGVRSRKGFNSDDPWDDFVFDAADVQEVDLNGLISGYFG